MQWEGPVERGCLLSGSKKNEEEMKQVLSGFWPSLNFCVGLEVQLQEAIPGPVSIKILSEKHAVVAQGTLLFLSLPSALVF